MATITSTALRSGDIPAEEQVAKQVVEEKERLARVAAAQAKARKRQLGKANETRSAPLAPAPKVASAQEEVRLAIAARHQGIITSQDIAPTAKQKRRGK